MNNTQVEKMRIATRYWLQAKAETDPNYYRVLKAIDIMERFHTGFRKDGVTPNIVHQYSIFNHLKTLHAYMVNPVATFIAAFLHDTYEDFPESDAELKREFPEEYEYIVRVSKIRNGVKIAYDQYFDEMQNCVVCSMIKAVDRIHNISTMIGVFKAEKQMKYLEEVDQWFLPMLKYARRKFPTQELAYENLKTMLLVQRDTILAVRKELMLDVDFKLGNKPHEPQCGLILDKHPDKLLD